MLLAHRVDAGVAALPLLAQRVLGLHPGLLGDLHLVLVEADDQVREKWRELAAIALERYPPPEKVLGRAGVLAVHPHHRPTRSNRSPAPKVHTTCRRLRAAWLAGYAGFVDAYRAALQRLREGWVDAGFPPQECLPACLLGAPGG